MNARTWGLAGLAAASLVAASSIAQARSGGSPEIPTRPGVPGRAPAAAAERSGLVLDDAGRVAAPDFPSPVLQVVSPDPADGGPPRDTIETTDTTTPATIAKPAQPASRFADVPPEGLPAVKDAPAVLPDPAAKSGPPAQGTSRFADGGDSPVKARVAPFPGKQKPMDSP